MTNKTTLALGAKAPLSFFPLYFFKECHDNLWFQILDLPQHNPPLGHYQTLSKSPLEYLGLTDLKYLFYYESHQILPFIKASRPSTNLDNEDIQKRNYHIFRLKDLTRFIQKLEGNEANKFSELSLCYLHFYLALCEDGKKSRKIMRIASYHLEQFSSYLNEEQDHDVYLYYLRSLIEVGCGNWTQATTILHKAIKLQSHPPLVKLLCRLYIEIDMPNVSKFLYRKYGNSYNDLNSNQYKLLVKKA